MFLKKMQIWRENDNFFKNEKRIYGELKKAHLLIEAHYNLLVGALTKRA